MLATEYANYYNIPPQMENESDNQFQHRVAGALRDAGLIIEAHEAQHNARYDENDNVMAGITGAIAMALQGVNYGSTGSRLVGDELAAGTIALAPKSDFSADELMIAMMLRGYLK